MWFCIVRLRLPPIGELKRTNFPEGVAKGCLADQREGLVELRANERELSGIIVDIVWASSP